MNNEPQNINPQDVGTLDPQQSNLQQAIQEMRNMREAYDAIAGAAEAYNVGKTQLAQAITSKGVETSPTESYPEMAEKVAQIPQETTICEGADSYGKQLSADGVLWDLYQVLADMKTRFMGTGDYASLIVCEYYKGYPSLVLQGADGYYTCDGDYYDYAAPNHIWHDDDNGKMNRWVAFLYRNEGARLDITNTSISPRSMYIGGHIGTIEYFVNGRLTDFVCGIEETDVLDNFLQKDFTQAWNKNVVINARHFEGLKTTGTTFISVNCDTLPNPAEFATVIDSDAEYIYIKNTNDYSCGYLRPFYGKLNAVGIITTGGNIRSDANGASFLWLSGTNNKLKFIHAYNYIGGKVWLSYGGSPVCSNFEDFLVGEATISIEAKYWNPTAVLADEATKARLIDNIKNHILARVSDRTGLSQLVFTVSTNMYNKIASEQIEWQGEMMSLADAFLTKNWLLAGA